MIAKQMMSSSNKRLLLVEDNPLFIEQISLAINDLPNPWDVVSCPTGKKAMATLDGLNPTFDLALVDLGLPDMSGIEIIRACRQRMPKLPIVVVSVIATERTVLNAIEAGANGYLLKDDSIEQITQGIDQIMNGIYPLSPSLARLLFKRLTAETEQETRVADFKLTPREQETLEHMALGHSYDAVAGLMGVAVSTIQWNIRNIYRKLNVHSQVQAVAKAKDFNLI
jgi:DNA-binding NarL/FixJ family response regulator